MWLDTNRIQLDKIGKSVFLKPGKSEYANLDQRTRLSSRSLKLLLQQMVDLPASIMRRITMSFLLSMPKHEELTVMVVSIARHSEGFLAVRFLFDREVVDAMQ